MQPAMGRRVLRGAGVGLAWAMLAPGAAAIYAQPIPADANGAAGPAQAPRPDYRFEVASIRTSDGPKSFSPGHGPGPAYTPGRFREEDRSLAGLVYEAFNIRHGYEIEMPGWMGTIYFTVDAKLPEGAGKADVAVMLQHLLEERFALKVHLKTAHVAGYELVVAQTGAKLAKGVPPDPSQPKVSPYDFSKDGMTFAKGARSGFFMTDGGGTCCTAHWLETNVTMKQLASSLAEVTKLNAPVMDATGLEGTYGFTLVYTPEPYTGGGAVMVPVPVSTAAPAAGEGGAAAPMDRPLLRDALKEQLGLRLQPVKDVSIDVVVVDSANREPTEN
jgi:uncharacterized protein (TIGR03435 family)